MCHVSDFFLIVYFATLTQNNNNQNRLYKVEVTFNLQTFVGFEAFDLNNKTFEQ